MQSVDSHENHSLPDGNKRVAYLATLEFLVRESDRVDAILSVDETLATIESVAAGTTSESELWVAPGDTALSPLLSRGQHGVA